MYQSKSVSAALMSLFRLADLPKPSELGCIEFQHQPSEHDSCDIQTAMQREFTLFTLYYSLLISVSVAMNFFPFVTSRANVSKSKNSDTPIGISYENLVVLLRRIRFPSTRNPTRLDPGVSYTNCHGVCFLIMLWLPIHLSCHDGCPYVAPRPVRHRIVGCQLKQLHGFCSSALLYHCCFKGLVPFNFNIIIVEFGRVFGG